MRKAQITNLVWGLVFILISLIGGVIIGGIVGHSLGYLIAGICFAIVGVVLLLQPVTFRPTAVPDDEFHAVATWTQLAWWAWIIVIVLVIGGILALVFAKDVPI